MHTFLLNEFKKLTFLLIFSLFLKYKKYIYSFSFFSDAIIMPKFIHI